MHGARSKKGNGLKERRARVRSLNFSFYIAKNCGYVYPAGKTCTERVTGGAGVYRSLNFTLSINNVMFDKLYR